MSGNSAFQVLQPLVAGLVWLVFKKPAIQGLLLSGLVLLLCRDLGTTAQIPRYGKRRLPVRFGLRQQPFNVEAIYQLFRKCITVQVDAFGKRAVVDYNKCCGNASRR